MADEPAADAPPAEEVPAEAPPAEEAPPAAPEPPKKAEPAYWKFPPKTKQSAPIIDIDPVRWEIFIWNHYLI